MHSSLSYWVTDWWEESLDLHSPIFVADLRAEVRCRYGAGTAPIAAKTDFIRALNGPLTVHRLKRPFKSVPTTDGDVYRSQNMRVSVQSPSDNNYGYRGARQRGPYSCVGLPVSNDAEVDA